MITKEEIKKLVNEEINKVVPLYLKNAAFTDRKLTDMPTDALQVTPRKYVNLNGTTALRPTGQIAGQQYFDTTIGRPIYFNPNSSVWTDGAGSIS